MSSTNVRKPLPFGVGAGTLNRPIIILPLDSAAVPTLGVQSRHRMAWIEFESLWLFCPAFADELVRREASERLEPSRKVVGVDEV